MCRNAFRAGLIIGFFTLVSASALADGTSTHTDSTKWFTPVDPHPYSELFTIEAGTVVPNAITVRNSSGAFQYLDKDRRALQIEPGWSIKLFHLFGAAFYLGEGLPISVYHTNAQDRLTLFTMGADTRLRIALEIFPWRPVTPFVEGGYQLTVYSQTGTLDAESADGLIGNFAGGAGFQLWLNALFLRQPSEAFIGSTPVLFTARWNRVLPQHGDVDLGSSIYMGGLSLGF